eukprot:s4659_g1.t1
MSTMVFGRLRQLSSIARKKKSIALLKVALDSGSASLLEAAIAECEREGAEGEVNLDTARRRLMAIKTAAWRMKEVAQSAVAKAKEPEVVEETPQQRAANMLQAAICHEPLDARLLRLALQEARVVGLQGPEVQRAQECVLSALTPWQKKRSNRRVQSNMSSLLNVHHLPPTRVLRSVLRRVKNPGISLGEPKKASCREVFTAFWTLFIPYFLHRRTRCKAFFLLSVTMVFMYLEVSTGVAIAAQTKELQNSLVLKKDWRMLPCWDKKHELQALYYLWFLVGSPAEISDKSCFYRLKILYGNLDNPDQRIAQDIGNFTRTSVTLIQKLALDERGSDSQ